MATTAEIVRQKGKTARRLQSTLVNDSTSVLSAAGLCINAAEWVRVVLVSSSNLFFVFLFTFRPQLAPNKTLPNSSSDARSTLSLGSPVALNP